MKKIKAHLSCPINSHLRCNSDCAWLLQADNGARACSIAVLASSLSSVNHESVDWLLTAKAPKQGMDSTNENK